MVGVSTGQTLGRLVVDGGIEAQMGSGAWDAAAQLAYYRRVAEQLATSPQAGVAIREFSSALDQLPLDSGDLALERERLEDHYREEYLDPLKRSGEDVELGDILPDDPSALYLQTAYSLPGRGGAEAIGISDAGDASTWTQVHAGVHPSYRDVVRQAGLLDIYLVDAGSERVVYSASKGPELGTSLAVGPFSGSLVARTAGAAADAAESTVSDLSYYRAEPGVPVGAAAAPVRAGDELVGLVVVTYDGTVYTERLGSLVESGSRPEDRALYLVGLDGTTRSDPQAYLADPDAFLAAGSEAGALTEDARDTIEATGTTVLTLPATDATVNAARDDDSRVTARTSITGTDVVGAVEPVPVDDVDWFVVSELDAEVAGSAVSSFRQILLVGTAVFVVGLAFAAVAWANRFMQPVRVISERLAREALLEDDEPEPAPVVIPPRSPVEFHRLADSFTAMGRSLRGQLRELAEARAARLSLLERMLPASIAQRVARGDVDSVEEVPTVTVAVVVVLGLGSLVGVDSSSARGLLDDLHAELDDIAVDHGLDRIKVVGDSYFAVCGHDRPYIDHAPRAVAFAERVAEAVRAAGRASSAPLEVTVGVNTGPVMVGMSGGARLVYDVWGPTVTTAHDLARSARPGDIVVTDATRARLPDDIEVTPWQAAGSTPLRGGTSRSDADAWAVVVPATHGASLGTEVDG